jgi:hypothetical protein
VIGCWKEMHNDKLHNLYIFETTRQRVLRYVRYAAPIGLMRNTYNFLVEKSERKGHTLET